MDDTIDLLLDLKHDLGKYIAMPLSFLPPTADDAAVRKALHKALLETRVAGGATRSARQMWEAFVGEAAAVSALSSFSSLSNRVERALGWEEHLGSDGPIDRQQAESDLGAVSDAIAALIAQVEEES